MITQIDIVNFRSIKEQSIKLKKFNILYGPNGSGKSSVAYAPYVMRNFMVNPNQRLDSLFNLGFINLGGFENVSKNDYDIYITIHKILNSEFTLREKCIGDYLYKLSLYRPHNLFSSTMSYSYNDKYTGEVALEHPYLLNNEEFIFDDLKLIWNGLTFQTTDKNPKAYRFSSLLNSLYQEIVSIEVISVKRGFFSPIFSTEQATEESLFAMQIRDEGNSFESKIDYYFKQLFNKTFRFVAIPGSTSFYLKTQNAKGFTTDLVNEGFGVNQSLYILIKLLKKSTQLAFIEEPEIHLHPTAQAKLVDIFAEIIKNENKQIFITTHSENIVSSVLAKIANGELNKDDVQFYLAKSEDGETKIIPQEVNDKGQIEGGLINFMETELSNLKTMLGV